MSNTRSFLKTFRPQNIKPTRHCRSDMSNVVQNKKMFRSSRITVKVEMNLQSRSNFDQLNYRVNYQLSFIIISISYPNIIKIPKSYHAKTSNYYYFLL